MSLLELSKTRFNTCLLILKVLGLGHKTMAPLGMGWDRIGWECKPWKKKVHIYREDVYFPVRLLLF